MATLDDILEHHGIKGMKWGVRKDRGHEGEQVRTRKLAKLDKKFEKKAASMHTWVELHNRAAELSNARDIDRINNKPAYKNADFTKDSPLRKQYYNEQQMSYVANVKQAAKEYGSNASGTRELKITTLPGGDWAFSIVDAKHDALDELDGTTVKVSYDATGHIAKVGAPSTTVAHFADRGADFLEHYGVKGMKWGQHLKAKVQAGKAHVKKDIKERTSTETTVRIKAGQMVRVVGGNKRTAHEDAINARVAEQIAKKNTLDALSNKELGALVQRMNLEAQYRNLAFRETRKSAGEKAVGDLLASPYADVAFTKLGPHAAVGKKVADGAFKRATQNKGLLGGTVKKDKK